ncbi:hypothetical protein H6G76_31630 [Nostoc sp. FACHB-152]|uniref:hypothetical protein n=1 Tax=unclassified Nostoc TaxID=2593658 RepID=UPI001682D591|nr:MULTISPECIES: hypothetical protein [unclassified Nostoc]MBD2451590.1 hypothetical protein [Nostoc sp. FACHB-152]MBD2472069.1 hypothetical protein [Nostoc sp. FACHB-145]
MSIQNAETNSGLFVELSTEEQQLVSGGYTSRWACISRTEYADKVDIWWGHTQQDAEWACNNWVPKCTNDGGCQAFQI